MKRYRVYNYFIIISVFGYSILGIYFKNKFPNKWEVFPVFSWSLFSWTPNKMKEFVVEIHSIKGEKLKKSKFFHEMRKYFPKANSPTPSILLRRLGRSLRYKRKKKAQKLRNLFEKRFLLSKNSPIRYSLIKRYYKPLERWNDRNSFLTKRNLGDFIYEPEKN